MATKPAAAPSAFDTLSRAILPIPDAAYVGLTTYDAKDPRAVFADPAGAADR